MIIHISSIAITFSRYLGSSLKTGLMSFKDLSQASANANARQNMYRPSNQVHSYEIWCPEDMLTVASKIVYVNRHGSPWIAGIQY